MKKFLKSLKHAFAVPADEDFNEEELKLLDKIAEAVIKRKMAMPAIMFLESVRPLNFLGSQALVFLQPIVGLVISTAEMERAGQILERRKSIGVLIDKIEEKDANHESTKLKK